MPLSDSKKVQALINTMGSQATIIWAAVTEMERVKALFLAANPNVAGTPLQGNVVALNAALTAIRTEADKAIWTALIAAVVPTHRGGAL